MNTEILQLSPDDKTIPGKGNEIEGPEMSSPTAGDTASPTGAVHGMNRFKAVTPKLSAATDPFFLDMDYIASLSKPVNSGVQGLRER